MRKIELVDVMRYYVSYIDIEKRILKEIDSNDEATRLLALQRYMNSYMKIGRNFLAGTDTKVFWVTKNYFMEGGRDIEELSKRFFTNELLNAKIQNAKVAASKLLWLFNHSVIIMDNFNREVLKVKTDNYLDYTNAWELAYEAKWQEIESVLTEFNLKRIDPVMSEEWFKMRVFDQYLWSLK